MNAVISWDIENVSIHNLDRIMERIGDTGDYTKRYVVYSKIKGPELRVLILIFNLVAVVSFKDLNNHNC